MVKKKISKEVISQWKRKHRREYGLMNFLTVIWLGVAGIMAYAMPTYPIYISPLVCSIYCFVVAILVAVMPFKQYRHSSWSDNSSPESITDIIEGE